MMICSRPKFCPFDSILGGTWAILHVRVDSAEAAAGLGLRVFRLLAAAFVSVSAFFGLRLWPVTLRTL